MKGPTPGEWELYAGHLIRAVNGAVAAPIAELEEPYRRGTGFVRGEAERRANGHLLAASKKLLAACESALAQACECVECGDPGVCYFTTEGDGPFWLCKKVRIGDDEHGDHAMPERYSGEEVEAPNRPLDDVRAAIAIARGR